MKTQNVTFCFITGIKKELFSNVRLQGSWNALGEYADQWSEHPMQSVIGEDGCPAFEVTLPLTSSGDETFKWGVIVDSPGGTNLWGIVTEVPDINSTDRYRSFKLSATAGQTQKYYFSYGRLLGANKYYPTPGDEAHLRFVVWAPHAMEVSVVFGDPETGYIDNSGEGIDKGKPRFSLHIDESDGLWKTDGSSLFADFSGLPYMYKIKSAQGADVFRTDIFSRSQIGRGSIDPSKDVAGWDGTPTTLDGGVSCSAIIDPDIVREDFVIPDGKKKTFQRAEDFWSTEHNFDKPLPTKVEDLVIYELHIGSLGFDHPGPGTLVDAMALLEYFSALGINAIELLPMAEFSGEVGWGYGDTHHLVIENSAGGRDQYRHFIRECHRHGIAVIQDVVYNHYDPNAERAQWQYDSTAHEQNSYYWYEGVPSQYKIDTGGYLDNGSSGWSPNFREEIVRQQFISGAVFLIEEMHVDGLRVDLTQAIHRDNALHENGNSVGVANQMGQKFLREWSRTLKILHPSVMLIAEDHTGWDAVTKVPAAGGLGFDAAWYADFYHALIGDSNGAAGRARLLKQAGYGTNEPLAMDKYAETLWNSQYKKVVYHESHDEAGNADGSNRTMPVAVNNSPLLGDTRAWAENRSRAVFGMSVFSAGTPMFFMGEEIAAQKIYRYDTFLNNRENLAGERIGNGAKMFRFYQDMIKLSRQLTSVREKNIDIVHVNNVNRVIAFKRWEGNEQVLIIVSLNNSPFQRYTVRSDSYRLPDGVWKEIFNSDAAIYGGFNVGNGGAYIPVNNGTIGVSIPANGVLVFIKQD